MDDYSLLKKIKPSYTFKLRFFFLTKIVIPTDPKPFRPSSKLPFVSTMLEKEGAEQLNVYIEQNHISDVFQSCLRKNHSTGTDSHSGRKSRLDPVDHSIMIPSLRGDYGLSGSVLAWFLSYLSGRTFLRQCKFINL